jgi:hypothetical protein
MNVREGRYSMTWKSRVIAVAATLAVFATLALASGADSWAGFWILDSWGLF